VSAHPCACHRAYTKRLHAVGSRELALLLNKSVMTHLALAFKNQFATAPSKTAHPLPPSSLFALGLIRTSGRRDCAGIHCLSFVGVTVDVTHISLELGCNLTLVHDPSLVYRNLPNGWPVRTARVIVTAPCQVSSPRRVQLEASKGTETVRKISSPRSPSPSSRLLTLIVVTKGKVHAARDRRRCGLVPNWRQY